MNMNKKKLETEIFDALKQYFKEDQNQISEKGRLFSVVPAEMMLAFTELLVAPVAVTLIAEYLLRRLFRDNKTGKEYDKLVKLSMDAGIKTGKIIKKMGREEKSSEKVIEEVSTRVTIEIEVHSREELDCILGELEQMMETKNGRKSIR